MKALSMLLSFPSFAARTAPHLVKEIRALAEAFGEHKGIPRDELLPALEDELSDKVVEADKEVDSLIGDLYPKQ